VIQSGHEHADEEFTPLKADSFVTTLRKLISPVKGWYDWHKPNNVPEVLSSYVMGKHCLTLKESPTATTLKAIGNAGLKKHILYAVSKEFPIECRIGKDEPFKDLSPSEIRLLTVIDINPDRQSYSSLQESTPEIRNFIKPREFRIKYSDPWKIMAGYILSTRLDDKVRPKIKVWYTDQIRIQDPFPPSLITDKKLWGERGAPKNKLRFVDLSNEDLKMDFILHHTHWGHRLNVWSASSDVKTSAFAKRFKKRLRRFLAGQGDKDLKKFWSPDFYPKDRNDSRQKTRAQRLIEVLKTIDGMFTQRWMALPEEKWTWLKFDQFVLYNLYWLITDEFVDGKLTPKALEYSSFFGQLKTARKNFKELFLNDKGPETKEFAAVCDKLPSWLRYLIPMWKKCFSRSGHDKIFVGGTLMQTRGCGTPPAIVAHQSRHKFLLTVTTVPEPLSVDAEELIQKAMEEVLMELPDFAVSGVQNYSRVQVTASACWEKTRAEGGTLEAIRELMQDGAAGAQFETFDLNTGQPVGHVVLRDNNQGEYLFWACLNKIFTIPREDLRRAFLTVVTEPGKARSVTKASAYLKVVLDWVSHICAIPIRKGIDSSKSGMGKSAHAWNFFRAMFTHGKKDMYFRAFNIDHEQDENRPEIMNRRIEFTDVSMSSTDYSCATDYLRHDVAELIAVPWMQKCGIPACMINLVCDMCYRPRRIYYRGEGILSEIGQPSETIKGFHKVEMVRGVLMGDPLTKVVLHLLNICVRTTAKMILEPSYHLRISGNARAVGEILDEWDGIPTRK
jgi:hypothetical protein